VPGFFWSSKQCAHFPTQACCATKQHAVCYWLVSPVGSLIFGSAVFMFVLEPGVCAKVAPLLKMHSGALQADPESRAVATLAARIHDQYITPIQVGLWLHLLLPPRYAACGMWHVLCSVSISPHHQSG
jgi:hypothetical protein